jgi:hypothetical protein
MSNFGSIVVADFEYEVSDGDLPEPLCMVAHVLNENLEHVHTIKVWRGEFGTKAPFDVSGDSLFVAYSAWAEMTCFKALGWQFPIHVFDLHTAYLAASNFLPSYEPDLPRLKERKRLVDACRAYGLEGWEHMDKGTIGEEIGAGLWRKHGKEAIIDYCAEDVGMSVRLLRAQLRGRGRRLPPVDAERVMHWSNYSAKAVAMMQARGMPIDTVLWNLVQENKAAVTTELMRRFDPSHGDDEPIYSPEGEWSYLRFERWLARNGVLAWPRLPSGALDTDKKTLKVMTHVPGIEGISALRDTLGFINKARLPIGRDGRNRPSLFPFGTATGRNAHRKSPFNAHAAVRSFMRFPVGSIGCYCDWRAQEIGIAAALSGDEALLRDYKSGDVYHGLALMGGVTTDPDPRSWKKNDPAGRQRMKALALGVGYGMGVPSLARGLGRHPLIASELIEKHKRTYPRFWQWRDNAVQNAMLNRRIESTFGWPLRLTSSPNERTLINFGAQSNGAEMLRLAAWRLCEAGIVPIMTIHDGILFEETEAEKIEHAKEIMLQAGRDVCDGLEIGVDVDQMLVGDDRYRDKRPMAKTMWDTIIGVLKGIGINLEGMAA